MIIVYLDFPLMKIPVGPLGMHPISHVADPHSVERRITDRDSFFSTQSDAASESIVPLQQQHGLGKLLARGGCHPEQKAKDLARRRGRPLCLPKRVRATTGGCPYIARGPDPPPRYAPFRVTYRVRINHRPRKSLPEKGLRHSLVGEKNPCLALISLETKNVAWYDNYATIMQSRLNSKS